MATLPKIMKIRTTISHEGRILLTIIIGLLVIVLAGIGFILSAQETQGKMLSQHIETTAEQIVESESLTLLGTFDTTFYCAGFGDDGCPVCQTNGITSTGTVCSPLGNALVTVAVDPRVIPYGTWLKILWGSNIIYGIAEDTGGFAGGLYGVNRIDICVANHEEAVQNGIAELQVYKVEGGN